MINKTLKVKVKVKFTLEQVIKSQKGNRSTGVSYVVFFLNY
jgi:hypothetical protein